MLKFDGYLVVFIVYFLTTLVGEGQIYANEQAAPDRITFSTEESDEQRIEKLVGIFRHEEAPSGLADDVRRWIVADESELDIDSMLASIGTAVTNKTAQTAIREYATILALAARYRDDPERLNDLWSKIASSDLKRAQMISTLSIVWKDHANKAWWPWLREAVAWSVSPITPLSKPDKDSSRAPNRGAARRKLVKLLIEADPSRASEVVSSEMLPFVGVNSDRAVLIGRILGAKVDGALDIVEDEVLAGRMGPEWYPVIIKYAAETKEVARVKAILQKRHEVLDKEIGLLAEAIESFESADEEPQ